MYKSIQKLYNCIQTNVTAVDRRHERNNFDTKQSYYIRILEISVSVIKKITWIIILILLNIPNIPTKILYLHYFIFTIIIVYYIRIYCVKIIMQLIKYR